MKQRYLIEKDNLGFRPVQETDLEYLVMLDGDPEIRKFFPGGAQTTTEIKDKIQRYIREFNTKGYGALLIFELDTGAYIGRAGFGDIEDDVEVGYLIMKQYWSKGYATRVLRILLSWAKDHIHRERIIAYTPVNHLASERVMQKAGMEFVKKDRMKGEECVIYEFRL